MGTIGLAFVAGALSTLSPCVLPLLPIVFAAALSEHKAGPIALAVGLALSFVAVGLFVAVIGFSIGFGAGIFRAFASVLLIAIGVILLVPRLQAQFAFAAAPVSGRIAELSSGLSTVGLGGQFGVGLLLGVLWSPCVGPTLGAASLLAAQGRDLGFVAVTMLAFGLGVCLPLVLIGLLSRETLWRWRDRMLAAGGSGKIAMGIILVATGLLVISGLDKFFEAALVEASPAWLTQLTTRF